MMMGNEETICEYVKGEILFRTGWGLYGISRKSKTHSERKLILRSTGLLTQKPLWRGASVNRPHTSEKRAGKVCSKCVLTKYTERYFTVLYLLDVFVVWQMYLLIKIIIIPIKTELTTSLAHRTKPHNYHVESCVHFQRLQKYSLLTPPFPLSLCYCTWRLKPWACKCSQA